MSKGTRKYFKKKIFWFIVTLIAAIVLNFILPRIMRGAGEPQRNDPLLVELAESDEAYLRAREEEERLIAVRTEAEGRVTEATARVTEINNRITSLETMDPDNPPNGLAADEPELAAALETRAAAKAEMEAAQQAKADADLALVAASEESSSASTALNRARSQIELTTVSLEEAEAALEAAQAQFNRTIYAMWEVRTGASDADLSQLGRTLLLDYDALEQAKAAHTAATEARTAADENIGALEEAAETAAAALTTAEENVAAAAEVLAEKTAAYTEANAAYEQARANRLMDLADERELRETQARSRTTAREAASSDVLAAAAAKDAARAAAYDAAAAAISADLKAGGTAYDELIRTHVLTDDAAYRTANSSYEASLAARDAAHDAVSAARDRASQLLAEIYELRGRQADAVTTSNEEKIEAADELLSNYNENPDESMEAFRAAWEASDVVLGPLAEKEEAYATLLAEIEELEQALAAADADLTAKTTARDAAQEAAYNRTIARLKDNKNRSDKAIIALVGKLVNTDANTPDVWVTWINTYDNIEKELGRDGGLLGEFGHFVENIFNGTFGKSTSTTRYPTTVATIISEGIIWTLCLQIPAILVGWILGNLLGAVAAYRRKVWDKAVMPASLFVSAIPAFGSAVILLVVFAINLKWFPVNKAYDPGLIPAFTWKFISNVLWHYQLPFWSIVLIAIGGQAVGMRSMSIYELNADYVKYSRFLGIKDSRIVRYVFRNAMLPQVTGLAMSIGTSIGGALVAETIFSYPGLGSKMYAAISENDYNTVSGIALIITIMVLIAAFMLDIIYAFIDPRVKAAQFD